MAWDASLTNLRDVLADLYPALPDAVRLVEDAGLRPALIPFDSRALTNWHNILREALKQNKVQAILSVALHEYPENEYLQLAQLGMLNAARGVDITEKVHWKGEPVGGRLEKIIGQQSTLLPISFLEVGLLRARSVVRVLRADRACGSGILLEDNLLLTNHHVLADVGEAALARVHFNYQRSADGLDIPVEECGLAPAEVFATSAANDWSVVKINGNPNERWGGLQMTRANIKPFDRVIIIQHPGGGPKQIALYHNLVTYADERVVQYLTDTMPGSSGSPVFDSDWNLVALHHSGGWLREPNSNEVHYRNEGICINAVIEGLRAAGLPRN